MDVPELIYPGDVSTPSTSSHSHELVTPSTPYPVPRPPRNKLRKPPPTGPSFPFVSDMPPSSHFPYSFYPTSTRQQRSPVLSPSASTSSAPSTLTSRPDTVTSYSNTSTTPLMRPKRTASMPSRKLTKQRPAEPSTVPTPPRRRATLSFSIRRRKASQTPPPSSFSAAKLVQHAPALSPVSLLHPCSNQLIHVHHRDAACLPWARMMKSKKLFHPVPDPPSFAEVLTSLPLLVASQKTMRRMSLNSNAGAGGRL